MDLRKLALIAFILCAVSACGGGGGGSSSGPSGNNPVPPPPQVSPSPSVSGDMLAIAPSRAWNYLTTNVNGQFTVTLYADPNTVNGIQPLVAIAANGNLPNAIGGADVGGLGLTSGSDGYHTVSFLSAGSSGPVPGSPLLVANTLTQGAVSQPYPGVTETVVKVGIPNGADVCSGTAITGATVQYIVANQTYQVSYVPGCGITDFVLPNGQEFFLQSIANYPQLGQLSIHGRVIDTSYFDLIRSAIHAALKI